MDWWAALFPVVGWAQSGMDLKAALEKRAQFEKDHPILAEIGGVLGAVLITIVILIILYILWRIFTSPRLAAAAGTAAGAAARAA